jgi:hypothetical protein
MARQSAIHDSAASLMEEEEEKDEEDEGLALDLGGILEKGQC